MINLNLNKFIYNLVVNFLYFNHLNWVNDKNNSHVKELFLLFIGLQKYYESDFLITIYDR